MHARTIGLLGALGLCASRALSPFGTETEDAVQAFVQEAEAKLKATFTNLSSSASRVRPSSATVFLETRLHPAARQKAVHILCADDQAAAYDVYHTVINDILLGLIGFVAASLHVKRLL